MVVFWTRNVNVKEDNKIFQLSQIDATNVGCCRFMTPVNSHITEYAEGLSHTQLVANIAADVTRAETTGSVISTVLSYLTVPYVFRSLPFEST